VLLQATRSGFIRALTHRDAEPEQIVLDVASVRVWVDQRAEERAARRRISPKASPTDRQDPDHAA
jgi:hypothetical protein